MSLLPRYPLYADFLFLPQLRAAHLSATTLVRYPIKQFNGDGLCQHYSTLPGAHRLIGDVISFATADMALANSQSIQK